MTYLTNTDARFCFNLAVSPGQEICGTVADYADYALEQPSTRVVSLFLEAVRDVPRFVAMLHKAQERNIPVIITKVGRTEKSAQFAASHSGALAGSDTAFQAVCERYGVIRTATVDEMMSTALLFVSGRQVAAGGLATISDSGGLREQLIDLTEENGVPFGQISADTTKKLRETLEHGLEPDNPLDAMGSFNADLEAVWGNCLQALADDPDTALIGIEFEFRDRFSHYPELFNVAHN